MPAMVTESERLMEGWQQLDDERHRFNEEQQQFREQEWEWNSRGVRQQSMGHQERDNLAKILQNLTNDAGGGYRRQDIPPQGGGAWNGAPPDPKNPWENPPPS